MSLSPLALALLTGVGALMALAVVLRGNYNALDWFFILSTLTFYYLQNPIDLDFVRLFGRPLAAVLYLTVIRHLAVNLWWAYGKH